MSLREFFHIFAHFTLLFSHQKQTDVWKGAVSVPLSQAQDLLALAALDELDLAHG